INSGQVCNCAARIYVQESIADEFTGKLVKAMEGVSFGDPLEDRSVDYGPLINRQGFEKVESLVQGAVKEGAEICT
ncbi:MAG: aldehyde dehydrogenase family protein, partial [Akkermansiaceae bacterium]|nr:aldehyde dehydrogenase family protein [Akkermansiaceae bacterium]